MDEAHIISVIQIVVCFAMMPLAYYCVIQTKLHYLRPYPGPFWARFTDAYGAYHSIRGDTHKSITEAHEKYGPVFRAGPNKLLFKSTKALHEIYGFGSNGNIQKSAAYQPMVPCKGGDSVISCINEALHKAMRITLQVGLATETLRRFKNESVRNIDIMIDELCEHGEPVNMTHMSKKLSIDSMGELAFGQRIGLLQDRSPEDIIQTVDWHTWWIGLFGSWQLPWKLGIEELFKLFALYSPRAWRFQEWRNDLTYKSVDDHGIERHGLFADLAYVQPDGKTGYRYTPEQRDTETSFILLAAANLNATALAAALFYLSRYKDVYDRLAEELRSQFATAEEVVAGPNLSKCQYLDAVITETLRIHPPSPGVAWRRANQHIFIDGWYVPAGTEIGCCTYTIHHDKAIFREPEIFWPERWLPGTLHPEELRRASRAYKPFSLGVHSCAGMSVALTELSVTLGRLMVSADFKAAEGPLGIVGESREDPLVFDFESHFTAMTEGPYLQFERLQTVGTKMEDLNSD